MTENKEKQFIIQKSETSVSQNSQDKIKSFVITKKIAKHGNQAIVVIPRILEERLKPGTIAKLTIDIVEESPFEKSPRVKPSSDKNEQEAEEK